MHLDQRARIVFLLWAIVPNLLICSGPQHLILLSDMGYCVKFGNELWAVAANLVAYKEVMYLGHSAGFDIAPWAAALSSVMQNGP
jgi:hypothetical protein